MSRTEVIKVYVTDAEKAEIGRLAREAGYESPARYLRERSLKQLRAGNKERELAELIRIVNCLHSLAIDATGGKQALAKDIRAAIYDLLDYIRRHHHARS